MFPVFLGAIAAAEDGAVVVMTLGSHRVSYIYGGAYGAAADFDVGVPGHHALLGAAIDVAHDAGGVADIDVGPARATHGYPCGAGDVDITLAAADDVAGAGVVDLAVDNKCPVGGVVDVCVEVGFGVLQRGAYGTAADVDHSGTGLASEGMTGNI